MYTTSKPILRADGSIDPSYFNAEYWMAVESHPSLADAKDYARKLYDNYGPFSRVLELGCGQGNLIMGFVSQPDLGVRTISGMDVSEYAVYRAPVDIKRYIKSADVLLMAAMADNSFDFIYSRHLLERLTHLRIKICLNNCKRIAPQSLHIIDVGQNVDMPFGITPRDGDQSRITMRSINWWNELFLSVYRPEEGWHIDVSSRPSEAEFRCVRHTIN